MVASGTRRECFADYKGNEEGNDCVWHMSTFYIVGYRYRGNENVYLPSDLRSAVQFIVGEV